MSTTSQTPIEDGDVGIKSPTPISNGDEVSRIPTRRKGVRKANSGGQLRSSSTPRQRRGTERSQSASSSLNKCLTPNPRQRVSKFAPRPSLDISITSTNTPTSDGDGDGDDETTLGSYCYSLEDSKPTSSVRSQIATIDNGERSSTPDSQKRRTVHRRSGSRSSDTPERDAASPHSRARNKPSSISCEDSLTNISSPSLSFTSPTASVRSKNKKQSSTPKSEDMADDASSRSERRKARSESRANGTKQRSSSRKNRGDSEKGKEKEKRRARRSRTPSSKKYPEVPNSEYSTDQRRGTPVSENEIMQLLNSTNDPPLVTREEDTQQKTIRSGRHSKSPKRDENRSLKKQANVQQRRRSNSSDTFQRSKTRMMRRYSNDGATLSEKTEKETRKPPGRSRSNNIEVDNSGFDSYFEHTDTTSRRKRIPGSSRGSLSGSKSVNMSGARTVGSMRSSRSSRRRRKDATAAGKSLKSISPYLSPREHHKDEKKDVDSFSHQIFFDDDDRIAESDYDNSDGDSDGDDRSVDLDLATARDNFAQQNINEKLQLQLTKTDELLYSVFPKHVADALRNGQKVAPENHELVTIFFSDIVGFTDISSKLDPLKISELLDRLYNSFDALSDYHDVFKVETIGDAYMAVTNLTKEQPDHCKRITEFAIDAIRVANQTLVDEDNPSMGFVNIRVGFHSGSVVGSVVGTRNPRYCLFGDTVNTASRMESNSEKNRIHCSERSAALLRKQCSKMRIFRRGSIEVKGKGEMKTFWIHTEGSSSVARDKNIGKMRGFMKAVRNNISS